MFPNVNDKKLPNFPFIVFSFLKGRASRPLSWFEKKGEMVGWKRSEDRWLGGPRVGLVMAQVGFRAGPPHFLINVYWKPIGILSFCILVSERSGCGGRLKAGRVWVGVRVWARKLGPQVIWGGPSPRFSFRIIGSW